jgi:hypothetical protein
MDTQDIIRRQKGQFRETGNIGYTRQSYPFLWIVLFCFRLMSCVSIVSRFSELSFFVFVLCLVYPMLPVSLICPFCLRIMSCVSIVTRFSELSFLSSSYVLCIQCYPFLWIDLFCLRLMSCVSIVARFSELSFFVFVLCLVYPLLPVSLNCPFLFSSYVLCIHCFPFLWIVLFCLRLMSCVSFVFRFLKTKKDNSEKRVTMDTQDISRRQKQISHVHLHPYVSY